ncbi:transcription factor bHLH25-like [Chenopodium quinoa]|uniref:transcription factor bHLH25-like n=1 Tax=Chenopodium quinoa TaxID=63459 RepID=UPI000B778A3B|nr:transcription factor bHLH25-like [Chenopodium quinoa]
MVYMYVYLDANRWIKTTILGDAIKHMKQLKEKVKELEVAAAQHNTAKSMVMVKKYKLPMNNDDNGNDDDNGIISKLIAVVVRHDLSITNCGVIPFENLTLDITIVAQMEEGFKNNVKGLVRSLRSALGLIASE